LQEEPIAGNARLSRLIIDTANASTAAGLGLQSAPFALPTGFSVPLNNTPPIFPAHDEHGYRSALSRFATGVAVVTAISPQGLPVGLTVSSFSPVSLHPPLVLWSLGQSSALLEIFKKNTHYAINVLREDQLDIALQFAQRGVDRFTGIRQHTGKNGVPLLDAALAWFECKNRSQYPEGDHTIFVGEVESCGYAEGLPLIHHSRDYYSSAPHSEAGTKK